MANQIYASIVPLNYGEHLEHSVTVVDTNWTDVIDLIAAPQTWLTRSSGLFGALPPEVADVGWRLRTPATAVIRPLTLRPELAPLLGGLLGFGEPYALGSGSVDEWTENLLKNWSQPPLDAGLFIAEFALDTSMLFITYMPPVAPTGPHYRGTFTDPTAAFLNLAANQALASVHCDLEDRSGTTLTTRKGRAQFTVDLLESRLPFVNFLNQSSAFLVPYVPKLAGTGPILIAPEPAPTPLSAGSAPIAFTVDAPLAGTGPSDFPKGTIEGLTPEPIRIARTDLQSEHALAVIDTCCVTDAVLEAAVKGRRPTYGLRDFALKNYAVNSSDD
jgi:hypothetical protein